MFSLHQRLSNENPVCNDEDDSIAVIRKSMSQASAITGLLWQGQTHKYGKPHEAHGILKWRKLCWDHTCCPRRMFSMSWTSWWLSGRTVTQPASWPLTTSSWHEPENKKWCIIIKLKWRKIIYFILIFFFNISSTTKIYEDLLQ